MQGADAVIVGAGVVGAACALACTRAGLRVTVVDRGSVAAGTTGAGEGNILVSDKEPGPELDLALLSNRLWRETVPTLDGGDVELETKGGLVVTGTDRGFTSLLGLAAHQNSLGIQARPVDSTELADLEPHLRMGLPGGVFYPQDMQVQPMMAAAAMLRTARRAGAVVQLHREVTSVHRGPDGAVRGIGTPQGDIQARYVVNAAGTWSPQIAQLAGGFVPVRPRRGFILVTVPVPLLVHHKVYNADYVANVASGDEGLQSSAVVEGTRSGTILIGATREIIGFDTSLSLPALEILARQAVELFPVLAQVGLLRSYSGFRPYSPDHLPLIGFDGAVPGLLHACGHEGAGIGLATGTAQLIADAITGADSPIDAAPFFPRRFPAEPVAAEPATEGAGA